MSTPHAVAGAEIEPGMTVILAPGEAPFVVQKVTPYPQANTWLYVFRDADLATPVQKNAWYADVSDWAEFSSLRKEVSSDDDDEPRVGVVGPMSGAPAGEGSSSEPPCSLCGEVGGHLADCVVVS